MKRKIIIIIIIAAFLAAAAGFIISTAKRPPESVSVILPWPDESTLSVFREVAGDFMEKNRNIEIEITGLELGRLNDLWKDESGIGVYDLAVTASIDNPERFYNSEHILWTGLSWSIYYNKSLLSKAGWNDGPPQDFSSGAASMEDLEAVFRKLAAENITPVNIGGQYTWPLAAWIQHLTLYEDPSTDLNSWSEKTPLPESAEKAVKRFSRWKSSGWINEDYLNQDWPSSVIKTVAGESAFVLIPSSLSTTIPREKQNEIGIIPFPAGGPDGWTVGSMWFLAVPAGSSSPEAAMLFADYLSSEKIVFSLQQDLRKRFFTSESGGTNLPRPSITNNIKSDFIKYIEKIR